MIKIKNKDVFSWVLFSFLLLYVICLFVPLLWSIMMAFKSLDEYTIYGVGFNKSWTIENILSVFENLKVPVTIGAAKYNIKFLEIVFNTVIYVCLTSFLLTFVPMCMGYVCSKYKYKLSNICVSFVLIAMVIPVIGSQASEVNLVHNVLNLQNNWLLLFFLKTGFISSYFLLFHAFFAGISWTYAEAAYVDGADDYYVMFKIMLPMAKGMFIGIFLLQFIANYNDYGTIMFYFPDKPTISYALYYMKFNLTSSGVFQTLPMVLAATFVSAVPLFVLFLVLKNKIMEAMNIGGIKG